jgi:hypothetical protein
MITRAAKVVTRPPTQRELVRRAESAYRRGYQQGAHRALCSALVGTPLEYLLHEWVGRRLHDWRYGKDRVNGCPPPEPEPERRAAHGGSGRARNGGAL